MKTGVITECFPISSLKVWFGHAFKAAPANKSWEKNPKWGGGGIKKQRGGVHSAVCWGDFWETSNTEWAWLRLDYTNLYFFSVMGHIFCLLRIFALLSSQAMLQSQETCDIWSIFVWHQDYRCALNVRLFEGRVSTDQNMCLLYRQLPHEPQCRESITPHQIQLTHWKGVLIIYVMSYTFYPIPQAKGKR